MEGVVHQPACLPFCATHKKRKDIEKSTVPCVFCPGNELCSRMMVQGLVNSAMRLPARVGRAIVEHYSLYPNVFASFPGRLLEIGDRPISAAQNSITRRDQTQEHTRNRKS